MGPLSLNSTFVSSNYHALKKKMQEKKAHFYFQKKKKKKARCNIATCGIYIKEMNYNDTCVVLERLNQVISLLP